MVIVGKNGFGDPSSNPGHDVITFEKSMSPFMLPPTMDK